MATNSTATEIQTHNETGAGYNALAPFGVRARGGQNVSRNYRRVDGLGDLYPLAGRPLTENVRSIAVSLFKFDIWLWSTLDEAYFHFGPRYRSDYEKFTRSFKEVWGKAFDTREIDLPTARIKSKAIRPLRRIPDHEIPGRILDCRTYYFYGQIWELQDKLARHARFALNKADIIPEQYQVRLAIVNAHQFSAYTTELISSNFYALRAMIYEARTLGDCIKAAAEAKELDEQLLKALKSKMMSINEHYPFACQQANEDVILLIEPQRGQWWNPEARSEEPSRNDQAPDNAVEAFEERPNPNSTLAFFIPIVSLLACIPAALSWYNSSHEVGTLSDPNFYQLISSSIMQLLSLVTLVWPMLFHRRLARLAWLWTWLLAGGSACMTVLAVSLFLVVPARWSTLLSFGGSVAQILVVLQLVYTI